MSHAFRKRIFFRPASLHILYTTQRQTAKPRHTANYNSTTDLPHSPFYCAFLPYGKQKDENVGELPLCLPTLTHSADRHKPNRWRTGFVLFYVCVGMFVFMSVLHIFLFSFKHLKLDFFIDLLYLLHIF